MMPISLTQILDLVGKLDDSPGDDTPRERFRRFLGENVRNVGQLRDYIEECLRKSGDQYYRALQDLVNHLGHFLGFEVVFGRYQGVPNQIGFDGHWKSPTQDFNLVIEVKASETFPIKTDTLVGYVNGLISAKKIPSWDAALGLYVVGRPNPGVRQLENTIIAEKRSDELRVISVESLLVLADLIADYEVQHDDILALIRPSGPTIDPIIDLMQRLVANVPTDDQSLPMPETELPKMVKEADPQDKTKCVYWLTPVKSTKEMSAEEAVESLVGKHHIYAFSERTPGRTRLKPGDWICFYANGKGVIAHARVVSYPQKRPHPAVRDISKYPWVFEVEAEKLYVDDPVLIDSDKRADLDAFKNKDPADHWAWFVQGTKQITEHDFDCLTRK